VPSALADDFRRKLRRRGTIDTPGVEVDSADARRLLRRNSAVAVQSDGKIIIVVVRVVDRVVTLFSVVLVLVDNWNRGAQQVCADVAAADLPRCCCGWETTTKRQR